MLALSQMLKNFISSRPQPKLVTIQTGNWKNLLTVYLCFILSGVAALIYQTAWMRQFSLVFGTSELAVASVLAAYMGGLAFGAYLAEKLIRRIRQPVLWYAALELGIALTAITFIPAGLNLSENLLIRAFGGQTAPPDARMDNATLFYLISAFTVLMIPTTLMGATLPLLARHAVHSRQQIGRRIGLLYACNTGGAVAGALSGSLLLLPTFGLMKTVWTAAAINLFVATLALMFSRLTTDFPQPISTATKARERLRFGISPAWILPLILLSGAVSFLHEVLWTRILGHILGSSLYAFGVMVASFLAGIALGGGLGAALASRRQHAARCLAIAELTAALAAIASWYALALVDQDFGGLTQRIGFGFCVLFPLAFAVGLTYPLAVRVLARGVDDAASASARVYSWNTVGAIIGALAGGFFIIPALRYEGSAQLAATGSCILALAATYLLFRPDKTFALSITVAAIAAILSFRPEPPDALLRHSLLRVDGRGEMLFYDVGLSSAVVMLRQNDQIAVRTNGLPEASINTSGTTPLLDVEAWMAPLAMLARPQLEDMLVIGFGGGVVLEAVPPSIRTVDVIELEEKVIAANRQVAKRRLRDPLSDPRFNFIINDARGALQLTGKKFGAIISQPSHPWTAGASHLYTREFMTQAKQHLQPGGLFVQWMTADFLDEPLLRSLVATLRDVYSHVRVYRPSPPTLLFLASDDPIEPERQITATQAVFEQAPAHYQRIGLNAVEDLIVCLALDDEGSKAFAGDAAPITDDVNLFATASVYDFGRNLSSERLGELLMPYDPLLDADSFIYRETVDIALDYVARRINAYSSFDTGTRDRLVRLAARFPESDFRVYIEALLLQSALRPDQAHAVLMKGTSDFPASLLLRDAALESSVNDWVFGNASNEVAGLVRLTGEQGRLVLEAAGSGSHEDWAAVARMDDDLARIPWTSQWHQWAAQLRIEWRTRVSDPALRPQAAAESIAMIDRINIVRPNPQLYVLRAWSALGADKPHVILESIYRYAQQTIERKAVLDSVSRNTFGAGINVLKPLLNALNQDARINRQRYDEIAALFTQAEAAVK